MIFPTSTHPTKSVVNRLENPWSHKIIHMSMDHPNTNFMRSPTKLFVLSSQAIILPKVEIARQEVHFLRVVVENDVDDVLVVKSYIIPPLRKGVDHSAVPIELTNSRQVHQHDPNVEAKTPEKWYSCI